MTHRPPSVSAASLPTVESVFRDHLREMRGYADEIAKTLGDESPIVKRIRSCARSNQEALDRLVKCERCGK